ncbi:MAG: SET domain-containing protein-lysine N-methyltransferase [Granulosicoccaceae bacterium]|jgi:SET domain-containing protein
MPYKKTFVGESHIHGKGLFAKTNIKKNTYLGEYLGPLVKDNGMHVLWVEDEKDKWIGRDGQNQLRYLNHSSKPNCEFDGFELYTIRSIKKHEELTFDYGYDPGAETDDEDEK